MGYRGRDRVVFGFIATESFISDLRQVGGFLLVLRSLPVFCVGVIRSSVLLLLFHVHPRILVGFVLLDL